ncbi:MAG: C40 family peptidase [Pseudomonadota bacterium]
MAKQRVIAPVADLFDQPNGKRARQLLFGEAFDVAHIQEGYAIGKRTSDGYVGAIAQSDLGNWAAPSHRIRDLGAQVYSGLDIKGAVITHLPFQAEITVIDEIGDFVEIAGGGFVHQMQIESVAVLEADFTRTAERYLGVPYLWGGNSQYGLDCSGLVSAALRSAGIAHPADSGDQENALGVALDDDTQLHRGDLIFWTGHVGIMFNETLLLHANGYHMKCVFEPLSEAADRIAAQGGGAVTSRRRV